MIENPERKTCTKCGMDKALSDFHRNKAMSDGRLNVCKLCRAVDPARYRPAGAPLPEAKTCTRCSEEKPMAEFRFPGGSHSGRCKSCLNEVQRERYAENPEAGRERAHQWYAANTDRALAAGRQHYEGNRGYYAAKNTAWVKANPEANRARRARYRARKAAAPGGGVSLAEWTALRDSYGCCLACLRTDLPLEPDHVAPLALRGRDHIDNIQPLCRSCNSSKRAKGTDYRIYHSDDLIGQPPEHHRPGRGALSARPGPASSIPPRENEDVS